MTVMWSLRSVGVATVINPECGGFNSHHAQSFSPSMAELIYLNRANLQIDDGIYFFTL